MPINEINVGHRISYPVYWSPTMAKRSLADPYYSTKSLTTDDYWDQQQQQQQHTPKFAKHYAKDVSNRPSPLSQSSFAQISQESSSHQAAAAGGRGGVGGGEGPSSSLEDFSAGEHYEDYLSTVLFDFGLQLSPGGTQVEEIEQSPDFAQEFKDDLEQCSPVLSKKRELSPGSLTADTGGSSATTFPSSKFKKITEANRIRAKTQEELGIVSGGSTEEEVLPAASSPSALLPPIPALQPLAGTSAEDLSTTKKKVKKYEVTEPLEDPELERRRLNAINARKNRVRQKKQTQELSEKNKKLENVIRQCSKALKRTISDVQKLKQGLEEKKSQRFNLEQQLRKKESEVREQREKLALFRGHLDLIASSLDDDNPARKLITNLLKKLPSDISRMQST